MSKLSQFIRVHALQPDIYYDETIQGITCLLIEYGRQYFRHSLMSSDFTGTIIEGQIESPTSTLGLLVN